MIRNIKIAGWNTAQGVTWLDELVFAITSFCDFSLLVDAFGPFDVGPIDDTLGVTGALDATAISDAADALFATDTADLGLGETQCASHISFSVIIRAAR